MTIIYYTIWALCGVLLLLLLRSFKMYKMDGSDLDVKAATVVGVALMVMVPLNVVVIYPTTNYDSLRFEAELWVSGTYFLPFPNEEDLVYELEVKHGECLFSLHESEKGTSLMVTVEDRYTFIEGAIVVRDRELDTSVDLVEGGKFWVHYEPSEVNQTIFREFVVRIIHQSPTDFHSKQITYSKPGIQPGWNLLKYERYTEDFFFTQPTDGL